MTASDDPDVLTRVNAPFLSTGMASWIAFCAFGVAVGLRNVLIFPGGSGPWGAGWLVVAISILGCVAIAAIWTWLEIELVFDAQGVTARRWLTIPFGRPGTRVRYDDIDRATFVAEAGYGRYLELWTAERRVRVQTDAMPARARIAAAGAFTDRGIALSAEYERRT